MWAWKEKVIFFLRKIAHWGASCFLLIVEYCDGDKIMTDQSRGIRGTHGEN